MKPLSVEDRFHSRYKVARNGCWLWTGAPSQIYPQIKIDGRTCLVHRWVHEHYIGPIPDGYEVDHLCSVPRCVNPAHLEAVTPRENTMRSSGITAQNARKTHCQNGHPFDEKNTYHTPVGERKCRVCSNAISAAWKRKQRALV